jgi:hypothetical protein
MTDDIDIDDIDDATIDRVRERAYPRGSAGGDAYECGIIGDLLALLADFEGGKPEAIRVIRVCLEEAFREGEVRP